MTQDQVKEMVRVMSGRDFWRTHASPALGLPAFKMTDGPNGARGDLSSGATAACFPVGVAMGATFDPDLLTAIGASLAREAKTKKAQILLGPTINLQRTPIGGRNFECYSEDPILTGALATAFVKGVQSEGVAACPKHFVANDTEYERHRVSANVDPRTLRELYLRPFEMVVQDAAPWMIMSSYNRINGVQANSNVFLLRTVLKGEWAFDGVVVSDWGGSTSTVGDYLGGLDLEMPGPARSFGDKLARAIERGEAPADLLDDVVARLKRLAQRTAPSQTDDRTEESVDRPDDRALTRRAAIAGAVLLKNEGVLPLDAAKLRTLAVIGPNAATGQIMGGGSSFVRAHAAVHPLDALRARLGPERVVYAQGCSIDRYAPAFAPHTLVAPDGLGAGFKLEVFSGPGCEGAPTRVRLLRESQWMDFGAFAAVEHGGVMSARMRAAYTPDVSGVHEFGLLGAGFADLFVDGVCVVENRRAWRKGEAFYTFGSTEQKGRMTLQAGRAYAVDIRFDRKPDSMMKAARFGVSPPQPEHPIAEAVAAAKAADAVVLVLGTNPDWETEGHDRADMRLPGLQNDLAAAVLAANPNAAVILNVGAPVDMPWLHAARAVLAPWFPGQDFGAALADILFGDAEPGGRLPFSWPATLEDSPAYKHYVREGLDMPYAEGLAMGYRGHLAHGPAALFSFGHGLGYADIALDSAAAAGDGVRAILVNRSARAGGATVQIYADSPDHPRMRQLCAFRRVALQPGERLAVDIPIDRRRLAAWDEARNGWTLAPGARRLHVTLRNAEDEEAAPVAFTV